MKLTLTVKTEVDYNKVNMTAWQGNRYDIEFYYKRRVEDNGEKVASERYYEIEEALERFKEVTEGMRK